MSFSENIFGSFDIQLYICTVNNFTMEKRIEKRVMVAVSEATRNKVAKKVAGTPQTIGEFFDESAKEKLKSKKTKSNNHESH